MKKIRLILDKVMRVFCVVAFASMVLLTVWQVATRYILSSPSTWSEELASYIFAWVTILGAAYVFGKREHMAIPIFVEHFSLETQKKLAILSEIIILLFAVVILVYGGISITLLGMGQLSSSLGVQMGVFYSIIPISGVFTATYSVLNIYDLSKNII
uniref:TRAP transporter small permease n=1 Tax=Carnobacterium sp. TaxID=48221 RepID=UPI00344D78E0